MSTIHFDNAIFPVQFDSEQFHETDSLSEQAKKVQYVYTIYRKDFVGNILFPLNEMKEKEGYTHVFARENKKYEGREKLKELVIPTLQCLWNDVVFLSPLHPNAIYKELVKIGYQVSEINFLKIPVDILKNKRVTCFYIPSEPLLPSLDHTFSEEQFTRFDCAHYSELKELPKRTSDYFHNVFDSTCPAKLPLRFHHIPHVLCQDSINISDKRISIIKWSEF